MYITLHYSYDDSLVTKRLIFHITFLTLFTSLYVIHISLQYAYHLDYSIFISRTQHNRYVQIKQSLKHHVITKMADKK